MVSYFSGVCCDSLKLRGCPLCPTGRSLFYLAALWLTESLETKQACCFGTALDITCFCHSELKYFLWLCWNSLSFAKVKFSGVSFVHVQVLVVWHWSAFAITVGIYIPYHSENSLSLFFNVVTFPDTAKFFFSTAKFFLFLIFVCVISVKFFQEGKETEGFHLPSWNQKPGMFLDFYFRRNIFYYYLF